MSMSLKRTSTGWGRGIVGSYLPETMSPTMRICEVSPYGLSEVSGVTTVVVELARGFASRGYPTILMAPGPPPRELPFGVDCQTVEAREPFRDASLSLRIARRLWRDRMEWDVLHAHQGHPATLAAALVARLLGRPVVTTFHLMPPEPRGVRRLVQGSAIRYMMKASTERVFVSEDTKRQFRGEGTVIHNGVDVARIRSLLGNRSDLRGELGLDGCVIAFAGRMARVKGYMDLLRAMRNARDAGADVRLIATGRAPDAERPDTARLVKELGIGPFIVDLGDREDHLRFLPAADVFALPSYREGLPISLLEAMAAGLPVIASEVGGIPEIIKDGREGFLLPPGDVDALADRILRLANRPDVRASMGERALESARAMDVARVAEAYLSVFGECARGGTP